MRGLTDAVEAVLDRRLAQGSTALIAVAISGGGDSVALALMAQNWAARRGRRLLLLTVDHGLRAESADWTRTCSALAQRLGADFQSLIWEGAKPDRGLPAAARVARHALLAEAARRAGATVILMGHTADDVAEAAEMRRTGSTTPDPRCWSPSPVWPQGRGLFLLRPLLHLRRSDLRAWLVERGETWIDDPANLSVVYARARARLRLAGSGVVNTEEDAASTELAALADQAGGDLVLVLPRPSLQRVHLEVAHVFTGIAALCAAGTSRPPRRSRLAALTQALRGNDPVVATLAGARIEASADQVLWLRDSSEMSRQGFAQLDLRTDEAVFDGRFALRSAEALRVIPLAGHTKRLSAQARSALMSVPPRARGGLPVVVKGDFAQCPALETLPGLVCRSLIQDRLRAACCGVGREPT